MNLIRILLVDDSSINNLLATRLFSKLEISIVCASSGAEAIEKAKNHQFDVILMDLRMPEIDGFETTKALRENGYMGRIIALTSDNSLTNAELATKGLNGCIEKPLRLEEVQKILAEVN